MKRRKKPVIAVLGGMGPQASAKLLQTIVDLSTLDYGAKLDEDFPEIILNSVPVPDFISNKSKTTEALKILKQKVKALDNFKPVCFGMACNTAHILLDQLQSQTNSPFISIIEAVRTEIQKTGVKQVGLLGTPTTVSSRLYQNALKFYGVRVFIPSSKDQIEIEIVIRNVLAGNISELDKQRLIVISDKLQRRGAKGIILGCTELPLVFAKEFSIPIFDSIEILASALLRRVFE